MNFNKAIKILKRDSNLVSIAKNESKQNITKYIAMNYANLMAFINNNMLDVFYILSQKKEFLDARLEELKPLSELVKYKKKVKANA